MKKIVYILSLIMAFSVVSCTGLYEFDETGKEYNDDIVNADGYIEITTAEQLAMIGVDISYPLDGNYILMNDISLSDYGNWTPIGNWTNMFCGAFDGNNKTISGLTIYEATNSNNYGLFGIISSATIKDLTILEASISITSSWNSGGILVAYAAGGSSTIKNCCVNGGYISSVGVAALGSNVGGVVGINGCSTITNCYNSSSVSGVNRVGGIVGNIDTNSDIVACYNTGSVSGKNYVGGIVGCASSNYSYWDVPCYSNITSCYNIGSVSGDDSVGGIAGISSSINEYNTSTAVSDSYAYITSCYNSGSVNGSSSIGGIVGSFYSSYNYNDQSNITAQAYITSCYFIDQANDDTSSAIGYSDTSTDYSYMTLYNVSALNDKVSEMTQAVDEEHFTAGSPSDTNLPHLMGENLLYTGVGAEEPEEEPTYTMLADFSATSYPTDTDTWVIGDEEVSTGDFEGLRNAIEALSSSGRRISLEFPNLLDIPYQAFMDDYTNPVYNALVSISAEKANSVGMSAFYGCTSLESAKFASAYHIGESAFGMCSVLYEIDLLEVQIVESSVFWGCTLLADVQLPKVNTIGKTAFGYCYALTEFIIPESLTSIEAGIFLGCDKLISVTCNSSKYVYANGVLYNSSSTIVISSVPSVVIGDFYNETVTYVSESAFTTCRSLSSVNLPNATSIGTNAFNMCSSLKSVNLPKVIWLGGFTFASCLELTEIYLTTDSNVTLNTIGFSSFPNVIATNTSLIIGSANSEYINGNTLTVGDFSTTFKEIIIVDNDA